MATVETRYAFAFARPDGTVYERYVYWETLYALLLPSGQVLAARRAVPLNDMMFAFYVSVREAIRENSEPRHCLKNHCDVPSAFGMKVGKTARPLPEEDACEDTS